MVTIVGNGHSHKSSNPGRDCITCSANILGKGMNPIPLPSAMSQK